MQTSTRLTLLITIVTGLSFGLADQSLWAQRIAPGAPGASPHDAFGKRQIYGRWHRYPRKPGVWYCYYLHKKPALPCYDYHYMVWYENQPEYCYLWNPHRRAYVGRWDYTDPNQWRFSSVINININNTNVNTNTINQNTSPKKLDYTEPEDPPAIPGGEVAMTPPPDLPPVGAADASGG